MDDSAQRMEAGGMDSTGHSSGTNKNGIASPSDTAFETLRRKLVAHAQRMLGSRAEAEDVVQDAWLKWHGTQSDEVHSPDAWLTTVTTRLAIDRLRRLQTERASHLSGRLLQPWLDALAPAADEQALLASQMSYGVTLLLERLKPDERVAFVLQEAFDCDYAEIAKILAKTPTHCRQIVHRAKERLRRAGAPSKAADAAGHARLVERLRAAIDAQDRFGLVRLFSDGVKIADDGGRVDCTPTAVCAETLATPQAAAARVALLPEAIAAHAVSPDETGVASSAFRAEAFSVYVGDAPGLALLVDGEVAAMLYVESSQDGAITALRIVTNAAELRAVNRRFGRSAIRRLLQRIAARSSWTRCGAVPVDVDA
jgi:RNA polymerase sigma factor (sigma-70 family)